MPEHFNGRNYDKRRRLSGSDRRGVRPVPDLPNVTHVEQSRADKESLVAGILERQKERWGIGNRRLPAFQYKYELIENINTYKATIVGGETGSGKSTQLPQYLYEAGYDLTIILVPRRVIADGLGERIREEMSESDRLPDFNAEEEIGIIHGERTERHENNKILVMTPNTYIRMADDISTKYGDKKVAVIADEIHEANLFTELAVGVAAKAVQEHDDWRIIAASATHNAETLEGPFQKINKGYVPKVQIEGRPFDIKLVEESQLNPMQAYARNGAEHEKAMIFTSGKKEIRYIIEEAKKELEKNEAGSSERVIFRILHGELTERELQSINDPIPEGYRLCIVSSPAGMSGITIPGVTFVASDGTINRAELDDEGAEGLARRYLSKAGVTQQIGRAGRDVPGGVGYLCKPVIVESQTRHDKDSSTVEERFEFKPFELREEHEPPEIWHTNLSRAALSMAAIGFRLYEINDYIPHRVKQIDILNAEEALFRLGALNEKAKITSVGVGMDAFPIAPELSRGLYEVFRKNRVADMARAALTAAALDAGGLVDFGASITQQKATKNLIRDRTKNDFIAQLDIMMHLNARQNTGGIFDSEIRDLGLNPKRADRAMKVAKKALSSQGIFLKNLDIPVPTLDEEQQMLDDFATGFIDMTYQHVGKDPRSKQRLYRSIHGNKDSTRRKISNRSFASVQDGEFIAGVPRWYEKGEHKDGTPIKHDIVDFVMPIDPRLVAKLAVENKVTQRRPVDVRVVDGHVVEYQQEYFGSITVGTDKKRSDEVGILSKEAQEVLYTHILNHPGDALRALRDLVNSLEEMKNLIPPEEMMSIRRLDAPSDITNQSVDELIKAFVQETRYTHEVDEKLRLHSFSQGYSLSRYYSPENVVAIKQRSPEVMEIGGTLSVVRYENGRPYVTSLTRSQKKQINEAVYLPDGREVYLKKNLPNGQKVLVSMASLAM